MFSCKTYKHSQNTIFTQHYRWLLLNTPNHILNFNKKNKVNYIKLNKHAKTFIMSITLLKGPFWDFLIRKLSRKFSSFLNLIASVSWTTKLNTPALLPTFQCAGGDGNASGFINILICHEEKPLWLLTFIKGIFTKRHIRNWMKNFEEFPISLV